MNVFGKEFIVTQLLILEDEMSSFEKYIPFVIHNYLIRLNIILGNIYL